MKYEIMFEVVPPQKRCSHKYFTKVVESLTDSIRTMKSVKTLNVPEIVDENYAGIPYYRNIDNRDFGALLREKCKTDIIVNKVAVYFNPKSSFESWIDETINKFKINKFIFVGGTHMHKYPGPSVIEANNIAKAKGLTFGNITIPTRQNEAENLFRKTQNGCKFFTSQIIFEPHNIIKVIQNYSELCRKNNVEPSKFFLSFSPVSDIHDIEFLTWLGAYFSADTKTRLESASNMGEESVKVAQEVFDEVVFKTEDLAPLALNVEQVSFHNTRLSHELVEIFSSK